MALSGTRTYNETRDEILTDALLEVKAIAQGDTPPSDYITAAARALNKLVKELNNDSVPFPWMITERNGSLSDGVSYLDLATDLVGIDLPRIRVSDVDYPLTMISRAEYDLIDQKTAEGKPTLCFFDFQATPRVYFYLTPDQAYDFRYTAILKVQDFSASTDNPDLTPNWLAALTIGVASRIARQFDNPEGTVEKLKKEYAIMRAEAVAAQDRNQIITSLSTGSMGINSILP